MCARGRPRCRGVGVGASEFKRAPLLLLLNPMASLTAVPRQLFAMSSLLFAPFPSAIFRTSWSIPFLPSLRDLIPPFLLAVPKKKVSHSRKAMRSANKGLKDKQSEGLCQRVFGLSQQPLPCRLGALPRMWFSEACTSFMSPMLLQHKPCMEVEKPRLGVRERDILVTSRSWPCLITNPQNLYYKPAVAALITTFTTGMLFASQPSYIVRSLQTRDMLSGITTGMASRVDGGS